MADSERIAGLVGPSLLATVVFESPPVQPHLFDGRRPRVVYLSGVLRSIAGLGLVRAHNVWAREWTVPLTLTGWFCLGLVRMFAAGRYVDAAAGTDAGVFMAVEGVLLVVTLVITCHGYRRSR